MKPLDGSKEDNRQRSRQRPSDSVMDNFGIHTSTVSYRRSSAQARSHCTALDPSGHHYVSFAPLSIETVDHIHATITARANSLVTSPPRFSPDTRRQIDRRCVLDEMIDCEAESTAMQLGTLQDQGYSERSAVFSNCTVASREQLRQESEHHTQDVTVLHLRVSTRRTKTTTRLSPSSAGGRHWPSKVARVQQSGSITASAELAVMPPTRPIANAAQNITFDMLQPHFERPLQQAADSFCVCTTLLKKICRRNGINNWPYRKICGLRKSIPSMAKQVNYLEGEQRRAYAAQIRKLEYKLQAYLRTGNEPTEELFQNVDAEAAAEQLKKKAIATSNEDEEKEAHVVSTWSARLSLELPHTQIVHELPIRSLTGRGSTWGEKDSRSCELLRKETPMVSSTAAHHRALPPIASILQHQNFDSPSRAASTQSLSTIASDDRCYDRDERQQPQWRYFPPTNDDVT